MQKLFTAFCSHMTFSRLNTRQAPGHAVQKLKMLVPHRSVLPQQQSQQKGKADRVRSSAAQRQPTATGAVSLRFPTDAAKVQTHGPIL